MLKTRFIVAICCMQCAVLLSQGIIIDHHDVALFDSIPNEYLDSARKLRILFSDRSVGQNIDESLDFLMAADWASTPAAARRDYYNVTDSIWYWKTYTLTDLQNGLVPLRILFDPDPVKYNRENWKYENRAGSWSELTQDFIDSLAPAYIDSADVLSYQFSYLNVDETSDIADTSTGFFANNTGKYDIYDLESFISQQPDKIFIFWTTSLARSIGTKPATDFNDQMRDYCAMHNKILFDMADIISHTDQGIPCFDNRDGKLYVSQTGQYEDYPDDSIDCPAICQDYTTEVNGGHLGSVSAGRIIIAKAFWVMMARICGWDGNITGTGPRDYENSPVTLTPNPSSDLATIKLHGIINNDQVIKLAICNITGQCVMNLNDIATNSFTINLKSLKPGLYFLVIQTRNKVIKEKIIKL